MLSIYLFLVILHFSSVVFLVVLFAVLRAPIEYIHRGLMFSASPFCFSLIIDKFGQM